MSLEQLGIEACEEALREALVTGFAKALDAHFSESEPEAPELEQALARVEMHSTDFLAAPSSRAV